MAQRPISENEAPPDVKEVMERHVQLCKRIEAIRLFDFTTAVLRYI